MKRLYLIRHAKSSWNNPDLHDFDRPLNGRGKKDAPVMGKRLAKRNEQPDLIISSSAVRAKKTALEIAESLGYKKNNIQWLDELYHASPLDMLKQLHDVAEGVESVFLVGHNPGLTELANLLSAHSIDNIVTSGVYVLQWEIRQWRQVQLNKKAKFVYYDFPKREGALKLHE